MNELKLKLQDGFKIIFTSIYQTVTTISQTDSFKVLTK